MTNVAEQQKLVEEYARRTVDQLIDEAKFEPKSWDEFFSRFTYKEGWTFEFEYFIDYNEYRLIIQAMFPDSRNPNRKVPVRNTSRLPDFRADDLELMIRFVRSRIQDLEIHESDEWIRLNGELVCDPHNSEKNGAPRGR